MNEQKKKFHLGDILTVITGKFLCPDGFSRLYELLDYLTGDKLLTHQLITASKFCKPQLLKQFPELADVDVGNVNKDNYLQVMEELVKKYGEWFEVSKVKGWTYKHPIKELIDNGMNEDKIMVIELPKKEGDEEDDE